MCIRDRIFMDGRKHPEDPELAWYGNSIGRWDGPTWVIDTIGFKDKFWFDYVGHPHTEKLHTTERYTRTDLGDMSIEVTIDDPGAYAKPFTTCLLYTSDAADERSSVDLGGRR